MDEQGSSLLALTQAAAALGYQAQGYRLALADLTGTEPLLAHVVLDGQHHFTVILGVCGQSAYLADPTLGYIAMPLEDFAPAFSGVVLKVGAAETAPPQAEAPQTEATSGAVDTASHRNEVVPETMAPEAAAAPSAQAAPSAEPVVAETPVEQNTSVAAQLTTPAAETAGDATTYGEEITSYAATLEAAAAPETGTEAAEAPVVEQNSAVEDPSTVQPAAELTAEAPAVDVEHAADNEPPANQPVQLDAAEMEQIKGRLFFVAGVAVSPVLVTIAHRALPAFNRAATLAKLGITELRLHKHHIVALNHPSAKPAQDVLAKYGISLNDNNNKVRLNEQFHRRLHTKDYFEHVNKKLQEATSREEAVAKLKSLQKELPLAWYLARQPQWQQQVR